MSVALVDSTAAIAPRCVPLCGCPVPVNPSQPFTTGCCRTYRRPSLVPASHNRSVSAISAGSTERPSPVAPPAAHASARILTEPHPTTPRPSLHSMRFQVAQHPTQRRSSSSRPTTCKLANLSRRRPKRAFFPPSHTPLPVRPAPSPPGCVRAPTSPPVVFFLHRRPQCRTARAIARRKSATSSTPSKIASYSFIVSPPRPDQSQPSHRSNSACNRSCRR